MTHEVEHVRTVSGKVFAVQKGEQAALVFTTGGQLHPEKKPAPATQARNVATPDDQRGELVTIGGMRCIQPKAYFLP